LDAAEGNQSKAAASLGLKLSTFRDKLAKYGIRLPAGGELRLEL
jgi:DNA-binding protein Fis